MSVTSCQVSSVPVRWWECRLERERDGTAGPPVLPPLGRGRPPLVQGQVSVLGEGPGGLVLVKVTGDVWPVEYSPGYQVTSLLSSGPTRQRFARISGGQSRLAWWDKGLHSGLEPDLVPSVMDETRLQIKMYN